MGVVGCCHGMCLGRISVQFQFPGIPWDSKRQFCLIAIAWRKQLFPMVFEQEQERIRSNKNRSSSSNSSSNSSCNNNSKKKKKRSWKLSESFLISQESPPSEVHPFYRGLGNATLAGHQWLGPWEVLVWVASNVCSSLRFCTSLPSELV